jgi:acetyl-CoA carboxylase biotin carboxylase subunit
VQDGSFIPASGHAIECRVYAEDPDEGFLPSPGVITHLRAPSGPGVRDDSGATAGWTMPTHYDPLVSKVISWAPDRAGAIARMVRALNEYDLRGIKTTIGFCREMLMSRAFAAGEFDTTTVERLMARRPTGTPPQDAELDELAAIAAAFALFTAQRAQPSATVEPEDSAAKPVEKPAEETPIQKPPEKPRALSPAKPESVSLWEQRGRLENLRW